MLRRLRENGPAVLVPAAWTVVAAAHAGVVTERTLLIAHLVMDVVIVAFTVLSWSEMAEGVLRVWRGVLVVGLVVTLSGTAALAGAPGGTALGAVAVVGWMLLPAAGLGYTGRAAAEAGTASPWPYHAGAALSALGAVVYVGALATGAAGAGADGAGAAVLLALGAVGLGQTVGIVAAAALS